MIRSHLPYFLLTVIFLVGIYCVVSKKNLVKIVVGLTIAEIAVNLFLVTLGYNRPADGGPGVAPIAAPGPGAIRSLDMVDPVPQALVVTSVMVSLATLILAVALCIRLYDRYQTYDITEIRRLRG
jgi:multicomponent Na+:H+ antiporter subunit C